MALPVVVYFVLCAKLLTYLDPVKFCFLGEPRDGILAQQHTDIGKNDRMSGMTLYW